MNVTPAQLTALKNDILADPVLSQIDHTSNTGYDQIAAAYNAFPATDFFVYRSSVPVGEIFNQIQWAKLTPADAPATTFDGPGMAWQNRALACQAKQFNLQIILQGQATIDASRSSVRAGLQDALTNVPSGATGAIQAAGWVGVRDLVLARKATRGEKLFADLSGGNGGTAATAAMVSAEGAMTPANISAAFS